MFFIVLIAFIIMGIIMYVLNDKKVRYEVENIRLKRKIAALEANQIDLIINFAGVVILGSTLEIDSEKALNVLKVKPKPFWELKNNIEYYRELLGYENTNYFITPYYDKFIVIKYEKNKSIIIGKKT